MKHTVEKLLACAIDALKKSGMIPHDTSLEIKVDRTKEASHGDFATNLALILSKPCRLPPRQVAEALVAHIPSDPVLDHVEIAGPGFLNFFMRSDALSRVVEDIILQGENYGCCEEGHGQKVLIEFVSANPTGPLHVGHGRGAAFGASLANLLRTAGYLVTCEYYVNDAGRQMDILAVSVWLRYLTLLGEPVVFPANGYKGDYVNDIAKAALETFATKDQRSWEAVSQTLPPDEPQGGDKERYIDAIIQRAKELLDTDGFKRFHTLALESVLADIKNDLAEFGVCFDDWFSERSLLEEGAIQKGIHALKDGNHTYLKEGALWFKSTDFGDEKDRVLIRANGQTTYFASDVAYHWNKYNRGFDRVIDIFGADHHGYLTRVRAAVTALGHDKDALDILLVQFAILYRGDQRVQMSTRSGSFVTLRELREEVGNDAARFFYVMRKPEQHMDFDLDLAKSESSDNPVYYVQYAHARISSVLRQLHERGLSWDEALGLANLDKLQENHEQVLINTISRYPEVIAAAARGCDPHQVAYYLRELANNLHSYYNAVQLLCEDEVQRAARLCLLKAIRQVLRNGLQLLGVSSPESM